MNRNGILETLTLSHLRNRIARLRKLIRSNSDKLTRRVRGLVQSKLSHLVSVASTLRPRFTVLDELLTSRKPSSQSPRRSRDIRRGLWQSVERLELRNLMAYDIEIVGGTGADDSLITSAGPDAIVGTIRFTDGGTGLKQLGISTLQTTLNAGNNIVIEANSIVFRSSVGSASLSTTALSNLTLATADTVNDFGSIDMEAGVDLTGTNVSIELVSGDNLTITSIADVASFSSNADGQISLGSVTSSSDIQVNSDSNISVGSLTAANAVELESSGGTVTMVSPSSVGIQASELSMTAISVGTLAAPLKISVGRLTSDTSLSDGDQYLNELDDVIIDLLDAGEGSVSLDAGGSIESAVSGTTPSIVASDLFLDSGGVINVTTDVDAIHAESNGLTWITENDDIDVVEIIAGGEASVSSLNNGSVFLGSIQAQSCTIQSEGVVQNLDILIPPQIVAESVNLIAANGIGTSGDQIKIQASSLVFANSSNGGVYVENSVTSRLAVSGNNSALGGDIEITLTATHATLSVESRDILSNDGSIRMTADDFNIEEPVIAGAARVTLQPSSSVQPIWLGEDSPEEDLPSTPAGTVLGLSDTELDRIETSNVLQIGSSTQAAGIVIRNSVSPTSISTLFLMTQGSIVTSASNVTAGITVDNLAMQAAGHVILSGNNEFQTVAAQSSSSMIGGGDIQLVNSDGFTVSTIDGIAGVSSLDGSVELTAQSGNLTLGGLASTGSVLANGNDNDVTIKLHGLNAVLIVQAASEMNSDADILVTADRISLNGSQANSTITAASGIVTLRPFTDMRNVDLGSSTDLSVEALELSSVELRQITALALVIGEDTVNTNATGDILVSDLIQLESARVPVLTLISAGTIQSDSDATPGEISVSRLAMQAKNGIGAVFSPLLVSAPATSSELFIASKNLNFGGIYVHSEDTIKIDSVGAISGIVANDGGAILISTATDEADIVVNDNILTTGTITLNADTSGLISSDDGGSIWIASTAKLAGSGTGGPTANAGSIYLNAEDNITLGSLSSNGPIEATSAFGSIMDDMDESSIAYSAMSISLFAKVNIGSQSTLTPDDIVNYDANNSLSPLVGAIDVDVPASGTIHLELLADGGNVQIRETMGTLAISRIDISRVNALANQLAIVSSGGLLLVDTSLSFSGGDLLLGATDGNPLRVNLPVSNFDGSVSLATESGQLRIQSPIDALTGISLASGAEIIVNGWLTSSTGDIAASTNQDLTFSGGAGLYATSGSIALSAGRDVSLPAGSSIRSAQDLEIEVGGNDLGGMALVRGSVATTSGANVRGGLGNDAFFIVPSQYSTFKISGDGDSQINRNDSDSVLIDSSVIGENIDGVASQFNLSSEDSQIVFFGICQDVTLDDVEKILGLSPTDPQDADQSNSDEVSEAALSGAGVGITAHAESLQGLTIFYSLTDTAGGRFQIDPVTGIVQVNQASLVNFETSSVHSVTVRATESVTGLYSEKNFSITVTNAAPTANDDHLAVLENQTMAGGSLFSANGGAADQDAHGGELTVNSVGGSTSNIGKEIVGSNQGRFRVFDNGNFSFDPSTDFDYLVDGQAAQTTITYVVSDGDQLSSTATLTITVTGQNDAPKLMGTTLTVSVTAPINTVIGTVQGTDVDIDGQAPNDLLTYSFASGLSTQGIFAINATIGQLTLVGSPSLLQPTHVLPIKVTDSSGASAIAEYLVSITPVNQAPVAGSDLITALEDQQVQFNVLSNDFDLEANPITVTMLNGTSINSITFPLAISGGTLTRQTAGVFTFIPTANFNGSTSFTYSVSDGSLESLATVAINVLAVNDPPIVANPLAAQVAVEDSLYQLVLPSNLFSDADDVALSIVATSLPSWLSFDSVTGTLSGTPKDGDNGGTITLTATDGSGASVNTGVTFSVTAVNDAPEAVDDLTIGISTGFLAFSPLGNDRDVDGPSLSIVQVNGTSVTVGSTLTLFGGTLQIMAGGNFGFSPGPGGSSVGVHSFTYTISDGASPLAGTDTASVTLVIVSGNAVPMAQDDLFTGAVEDTSFSGNLLSNNGSGPDADPDPDELLTTLLLSQPVDASNPSIVAGEVIVLADGKFIFTPAIDFSGAAVFSYRLLDGRGGADQALATINVAPVNDAPVVTAMTFTVGENATVGTQVGTVVATDVDSTGLSYSLTGTDAALFSVNSSGVITVNGTLNFEQMPTLNFNVVVSDGAMSSTAPVTISLANVAENGPTVQAVYLNSTTWALNYSDWLDDDLPTNGTRRGVKLNGVAQLNNRAWFNANQIVLAFSSVVSASLSTSDFELTGTSGVRVDTSAGILPRIDSLTTAGTLVRLNLSQSLDAGRYQLRIIASGVTDVSGNPLDGEWTTASTATNSGNGVAGGDFLFSFNVLPGDINNDGFVNTTDTGLMPISTTSLTLTNRNLNVNGDLSLNTTDRQRVIEREGSRLVP